MRKHNNNNNNNKKQNVIMNERIRVKEVRLIAEDGENIGVVLTSEALNRAYDNDLDLVLMSPDAKPPVAKIIDYGKYKFELQKKKRESSQKQKKIVLKEVRLSPTIDGHDFEVKMKQATKFLSQGNKVQFSLRFRGRMITHNEIGMKVINRAIEHLEEISDVESKAKMDGRKCYAIIVPKK